MYRLNRLQDALQVLSANMPDTPAKALLEAQLQHRLGNYAAAIATYNKLVQQHKVGFPDRLMLMCQSKPTTRCIWKSHCFSSNWQM